MLTQSQLEKLAPFTTLFAFSIVNDTNNSLFSIPRCQINVGKFNMKNSKELRFRWKGSPNLFLKRQ